MSLTLEDIARLSGVSRSTASRVINGDENVRAETRRRVLEVIQQNDFHPNLAARRLAAGRTNVIGLVIPTGVGTIFSDPYFSHLIQGVSAACNEKEFSVMLWLATPEYERRMIRRILGSGLVDGVIVSSTLVDDPLVNNLYESQMPFVLIGRHPNLEIHSIDLDNVEGAKKATLHLAQSGYQRIATITGPKNMTAGNDRLDGYRQALAEYGLRGDETLVAEGDFTETGGYKAMQILLPHHPEAVFAASDMMAAGAIRAIRESGLRVPHDIALVGYDDVPLALQVEPPLTTIRQPIQEMGKLAFDTLIDMLQNPNNEKRHIVLQPELIIRQSCHVQP
jgi:LacI family transcriptional regulator